MVSAEQPRGPTSARDGAQGSVRLSYHPPLLRPHGGLHDVTSGVPALKSGDIVNIGSDVRSKANIAAVAWGDSARPVYQPPLLRSHGGLHDMTGLMMKSGDVIKVVESDVHAKENVVAVAWGDSVRPVYHAPLLRSHGALHDATSGFAKSGEVSDVNAKENIAHVLFARGPAHQPARESVHDSTRRVVYHAPLLRSHGKLHDATSAKVSSGDTMFQSDVQAKENIVAVLFARGPVHQPARESAHDSTRSAVYHAPLLRSHGALHELTAQQKVAKSGEFSDVNSKENIVLIGWG